MVNFEDKENTSESIEIRFQCLTAGNVRVWAVLRRMLPEARRLGH